MMLLAIDPSIISLGWAVFDTTLSKTWSLSEP